MSEQFPFLSVIIPVRNAGHRIGKTLDAVFQQTYPQDRYEVIVVDNGSTDTTPQVVQSYPAATLLFETSMASPYPARNTGIRHARGEVIVLLDSDCVPIPQWLESGIQTLHAEGADMVGGNVVFTFSTEKTIAEMVDSINHINVRNAIAQHGRCPTANLFVSKRVFDAVGVFHPHVRSGGDTIWTHHATRAGYTLVYSPDAKVLKPARTFAALLKKNYRIGRGSPFALQEWGELSSKPALLARSLLSIPFIPRLPGIVIRIRERGSVDMLHHVVAIWMMNWLVKVFHNLGKVHGLVDLQRRRD